MAFACLFAFGVLNATLGPVLPYLRAAERTSYPVAAFHQVGFAVGGMVAGVLAARSSASRKWAIVVGLVGGGGAGLLIGYGGATAVTVVAATAVSALATTALIRVWALLADLHREYRAVAMSEGEVAVSLAGMAVPPVVAACASSVLGWRFATVIASIVCAGAGVLAASAPYPPAHRPASSGHDTHVLRGGGRTLVTVFGVVGAEFTLSFWAASYFHDDVGLAADVAVALVTTLYAANLVGRLAASRLARRMGVRAELLLFLTIAALGSPLLLLASNAAEAAAGLAVTGIGIGGTFPLASTLHVAGSERSADQALGQILAVAGLGQIAGPLAAGGLAQLSGLRIGLLLLPALAVIAALPMVDRTLLRRAIGFPAPPRG
jgi:MFS family permease